MIQRKHKASDREEYIYGNCKATDRE